MMLDQCFDRDGKRIPCNWFETPEYRGSYATDQRVGRTSLPDGTSVSTVWLHGIDHGWIYEDAAPIIFETMIFGGEHDQWQRRYSTEEEAMRGHLRIVDNLRAGLCPEEGF